MQGDLRYRRPGTEHGTSSSLPCGMGDWRAGGIMWLVAIATCQGCATYSVDSEAELAARAERILIAAGLAEDSGELISTGFLRSFQDRAHACGLRTAAISLSDFDIRREVYAGAVDAVNPDALLVLRRTAAVTDTDGRETEIGYWIKLSDPEQQRNFWTADVSVQASRRLNASEGEGLARELFDRMQKDGALRACLKK